MSGKLDGQDFDLRTLRDGAESASQSGIAHAELLVRFAEGLVAHDEAELARLRPLIVEAVGPDGLLETASVAANFQRMVRIADATGIPQDAPIMALGGDLIEELELRDFASADNTPDSRLVRFVGTLLRPIAPALFGMVGRMAKRATSKAEARRSPH